MYNTLFDTQHEADLIINKLKYGYSGKEGYYKILAILESEPLEIQNAIFAEIEHYLTECRGNPNNDAFADDIAAWRNTTLCENFAEKFGWNREQLIDRMT